MPFVKVRPRSFGGRPSRRAPFIVNIQKLRHAFEWLRANNPYYRDVEWREDWAQEWSKDEVDIGITREEDFEEGQALVVNKDSFEVWMQMARQHRATDDKGFELGGRLLDLVQSAQNPEDKDEDAYKAVARKGCQS